MPEINDRFERKVAAPMHDPCHTGEIVKYECLDPLGLTITRAARGLGVSR